MKHGTMNNEQREALARALQTIAHGMAALRWVGFEITASGKHPAFGLAVEQLAERSGALADVALTMLDASRVVRGDLAAWAHVTSSARVFEGART